MSQPLRAAVCLKRHSVMFQEISTHPFRIHTKFANRRIAQWFPGVFIHLLQYPSDPFRVDPMIQRPASETRTKAGKQSFLRRWEKRNVAQQRLARRARRTAKNPRCPDSREKNPVERSIFLKERLFHFFLIRLCSHA